MRALAVVPQLTFDRPVKFYFDLGGVAFARGQLHGIAAKLKQLLPSAKDLVFVQGSTRVIGLCAFTDFVSLLPQMSQWRFPGRHSSVLRIEKCWASGKAESDALFLLASLKYARNIENLDASLLQMQVQAAPLPEAAALVVEPRQRGRAECRGRMRRVFELRESLYAAADAHERFVGKVVERNKVNEIEEVPDPPEDALIELFGVIVENAHLPLPLCVQIDSLSGNPIVHWERVDDKRRHEICLYLRVGEASVTHHVDSALANELVIVDNAPDIFSRRVVELLRLTFDFISSQ